jgi:hypothetical protein
MATTKKAKPAKKTVKKTVKKVVKKVMQMQSLKTLFVIAECDAIY